MPQRIRAEHFRAIADYTYDWESWISPEGRTLWVNPAVERITGYSVAECLSLADYPLPLVAEPDRARIVAALEGAVRGTSGNDLEFRIQHKTEGSPRWGAISWQPLRDERGQALGYRTSVRDITERKRMEERLREAKIAAETAASARERFLATVSHELRSPMQSILGYTELLGQSELDERQRRWVRILEEQTDHLLRNVEDLLELSALSAGALRIARAPYEPAALVRAVVEALRPSARAGVVLTFECAEQLPGLSEGDRHRVRQVLTNLLANALKFTFDGSVRLSADYERGDLVFRVADTGIGIRAADLPTIFDAFVQAHGSTHGFAGAGLGLAICRGLAQLMGGTLTVQSREGEGSTFELRLPHTAPPRQSAEPVRSSAPTHDRPEAAFQCRVLVVDDEAPVREVAVELLRSLGHDAEGVTSGAIALDRLECDHFDLVLLDMRMPELDGVATARLLRARGDTTPIVAVTASTLVEHRSACLAAGMNDFVSKPMRRERLRSVVERVARRTAVSTVAPAGTSEGAVGSDAELIRELAAVRARDGNTLFERLLSAMERELPERLHRLALAFTRGEAGDELHALKGNLRAIGATSLAETCAAAELTEPGDPALWVSRLRTDFQHWSAHARRLAIES